MPYFQGSSEESSEEPPAFGSPWFAMLKTFVMMTGEFEYTSIFDQSSNSVPFLYYSVIIFIVFVLVMSIVIMNLLVGLAVYDIKEIQENAELRQLSMNVSEKRHTNIHFNVQVELVLDLERFFPNVKRIMSQKFLKRYLEQHQELAPKTSTSFFEDVLSKASITTG